MDQFDDKDWTWTLDRACPQCEFEAAAVDRDRLAVTVRTNAAAWRSILGRGDIVSQRPPVPDGESVVWSALEYGAHVRDMYQVFGERMLLMLEQDNPSLRNWNQEAAAVEGAYHELDPGQVAYALAVAAGEVADTLDRVTTEQWERPGARSDGAEFTVESLARYLLHDATHHVWDANEGFDAL